jgi:hypothetical protein
MQTADDNTAEGLMSYFLDSVKHAHRKDYPADMSREVFEEKLEWYRDGMNENNNCAFPSLSEEQIDKIYREYKNFFDSLK